MPIPMIIIPAVLFIQRMLTALSLFLKKFDTLLRINHQRADPKVTPVTNNTASPASPLLVTSPRPAKMAVKLRIVIGFVSVRINVEAYAFPRLVEDGSMDVPIGITINDFMPRYKRYPPPIKLNKF